MPTYHPSFSELLEYSAGSLNPAVALCVATHLHHCSKCREAAALMNQTGGELLALAEPARIASDSLQKVFAKIEDAENLQRIAGGDSTNPLSAEGRRKVVPSALSAYADHLPRPLEPVLHTNARAEWKKLSSCLSAMHLRVGQGEYEANFHRIRKGGKVLEHDHRDHEVTVVLYGSFSDESGTYQVGDYVERRPGQKHTPTATLDNDCLCLSVVRAPVKLTGPLNRLINPFIPHHPA